MKLVCIFPIYFHVYHVASSGNEATHAFMRGSSEKLSPLIAAHLKFYSFPDQPYTYAYYLC